MARQKLGQHFLTNGQVLERIAQAACGRERPLAVEIGPGKGALTAHLLIQAPRVVAIELDRELVEHLRRRWPLETDRLTIVEANALDVDWSRWGEGVLVGNLPYYVATPIISRYVQNPGVLTKAVFLIQKEVAERIAAKPGTRDYGFFSVECQLLAQTEYLFTVPPGAFQPPPKVESAVICLTPKAGIDRKEAARFLRFASACFRQKRKTLRNNLVGQYTKEQLDGCPEISQRAEQLSVEELLTLFRELTQRTNSPAPAL